MKKATKDKMATRLEPVIVPTTENTSGPAKEENLLDKDKNPKNSPDRAGGTRSA
jgi:hypothetical protein